MKNLCSKLTIFILLLITVPCRLPAQSYYYGHEKTYLKPSTEKILVKFHPNVPMSLKKSTVKFNSALKGLKHRLTTTKEVFIIELVHKTNEKVLNGIINELQNDTTIISAQMFYFYEKDSIFQGITDIFVVKLKHSEDFSELERLANETNTTIIKQSEFDNDKFFLSASKTSLGNAMEMANYFYENGLFEFAEPEFYRIINRNCGNDPIFSDQWSLNNTGQHNGISGADIDVCNAWEITTGREIISVAVLDDGVNLYHPDLIDNMLPGYDATGHGSAGAPHGDDAHGTSCAGIIAAKGNNKEGIMGIAHTSKIIPIRIAFTSIENSDCDAPWITNDTWIADAHCRT